VSFSHDGGDYVNYAASAWLLGDGEDAPAPLVAETGYWRLARPADEPTRARAAAAAAVRESARTADDVEALRTAEGGFDLEVAIVHSDGISELYLGQVRGPRIDLATDAIVRPAGAKPTPATRMYGYVDGHLLWAWDIAALGGASRRTRRHGWRGPSERAAMTAPFAALPGAVVRRCCARHRLPAREQRALAAGRALAPLATRAVITVTGPDRLSWLDSITSQALAGLARGEHRAARARPAGARRARGIRRRRRRTHVADRRPRRAASLAAWLTRMRFRLRVEVRMLGHAPRRRRNRSAVAALPPSPSGTTRGPA
jgi:hypothetical protein